MPNYKILRDIICDLSRIMFKCDKVILNLFIAGMKKQSPNKYSLTIFSMNMCMYLPRKERRRQLAPSSLFALHESLKEEKESQVCRTRRREKYFVPHADKSQTCKVG